MASNSSGTLPISKQYKLGNYNFTLSAQYDSYENQTHVLCHASNGDSNAQSGKDLTGNRQITSWRVEAEDKTATVYATERIEGQDISPVEKPVTKDISGYIVFRHSTTTWERNSGEGFITLIWTRQYDTYIILASKSSGASFKQTNASSTQTTETILPIDYSYTYRGLTVYYRTYLSGWPIGNPIIEQYPLVNNGVPVGNYEVRDKLNMIAWSMVYESETGDSEFIVAKFPIDIAEAGGGTWDDPGSTGEPSKTLHITVTGALSGRHCDPLNDTSYQYTPSDREQADVYGSGGVGGNGGAGGAGASTVIIYNCATDKAGYTEEIAIAKRHGYGSGAGKGGKGGDGCILVYY